MIPYDNKFPWSVNIDDLASKLESVLRERSKTRETILPFPSTNVPALEAENANALANFDRETQTIEYQASAAREGYLWFDPDTLRVPTMALNKNHQDWLKEARKRGKIVEPSEYHASRHSEKGEPPLLVRRGDVAAPFMTR